MKKCPKCGELKEPGEFDRSKFTKDSLTSYCRKCISVANRDVYQYYKGLGLCVRCHKDYAMIGSVVCPECAEKRAAYCKSRRKAMPFADYHKLMKEIAAAAKKRRQRRRNVGICRCGKRPVEKGRASCYECLIKERTYKREKRSQEQIY